MNTKNKAEFDFCNITKWHDAGILGQGITVVSLEDNAGHGANSYDIVKQVAPKANIIAKAMPAMVIKNNKLEPESYAKIKEYFEWIVSIGASVVTNSTGAGTTSDFAQLMRDILLKNNIIAFCSAGNTGYKDINKSTKLEEWIAVGACVLTKEGPKRASYSSVGEGLDVMGFTELYTTKGGLFNGTSCSCPFVAGEMALFHCAYKLANGKLPTFEESRNFLLSNVIDLQEKGFDIETGHGLFVLPEKIPHSLPAKNEEKEPVKDTSPAKDTFTQIVLQINNKMALVNGKSVSLDVPPILQNGRTLVPLRFIIEEIGKAFNKKISFVWDNKSQKIVLTVE